MKTSDVVIIGAGIIGLSLAIELRKKGVTVLIVERGEPGREASYAAAGMLADAGDEFPAGLKPLAKQSARMYPEFVHQIQDESGLKVDFRQQGTIVLSCNDELPEDAEPLSPQRLKCLEPNLDTSAVVATSQDLPARQICAGFLQENSVDPRALVAATLTAARHRGVDISSGTEVKALRTEGGKVTGVETERTAYAADKVVNCAGAWAGLVGPAQFPIKPIKGQMLSVVDSPTLEHVVRSPRVYLVPRSDGRLVIGSTLEDVGYNKQTDAATIQRLFSAGAGLLPGLANARRHEAWAGLRPASADELPILGETELPGYFVATGHYRDGILLAPVTARLMAELLTDGRTSYGVAAFSPSRFAG